MKFWTKKKIGSDNPPPSTCTIKAKTAQYIRQATDAALELPKRPRGAAAEARIMKKLEFVFDAACGRTRHCQPIKDRDGLHSCSRGFSGDGFTHFSCTSNLCLIQLSSKKTELSSTH